MVVSSVALSADDCEVQVFEIFETFERYTTCVALCYSTSLAELGRGCFP